MWQKVEFLYVTADTYLGNTLKG